MAYRKKELKDAVYAIVGADTLNSLGLPRATEECAIQLFLNTDTHLDATNLIREAVSDLRNFGSFKFLKG